MIGSRHAAARFALLGVLLAPTGLLGAQEWRIGAQAGRIRSVLDPSAEVTDAMSAAVRYQSERTALALSAGIPTSRDEPLWGAAALWQRFVHRSRGGVVLGMDVGGIGLLSHDRQPSPIPDGGGILDPPAPPPVATDRGGTALAGQLSPLVGLEHGRTALHARAGVSHFRSRIGSHELDRTVPFGDVQATVQPRPWLAMLPAVRHYRPPDEEAATWVGITGIAASSRARLVASVGAWVDGADAGTPWSLAGRLEVVPRIALEIAARRDALDPLYLQPAQTSWSAGLSIRLGPDRRVPAPPVPASYHDGVAVLELPVRDAGGGRELSIAGDFTDWKPVPMERHGDAWRFTLRLAPGVYHYVFVTTDGRWFVPEGAPGRRDDGMGGHVAVVVIE